MGGRRNRLSVRKYQESKKPLSLIVTIKLTKEISVLTISLPRELYMTCPVKTLPALNSGGFRNSERGVQPLAREARWQILGLPRPLPVTLAVRTEYLEATLGLVKCLEISKELIRECVTMPGCCCCMPLLHNHLMDSCSYAKIITRRQRGVHLHPPYPS